jgi:alkaline phosphatase D
MPFPRAPEPIESASVRQPSRRDFIRTVAVGTLATGSLGALSGCGLGAFDFLHGVASGDPLADRVILWTRVTPDAAMIEAWESAAEEIAKLKAKGKKVGDLERKLAEARRAAVVWDVALDGDFKKIVKRGVAVTSAEQDYTVKVDVKGLAAGTHYHYRFHCSGSGSATGRTRTTATGAVEQVKLAVFSCSNYPAGYFNVYAEAAKRDDLDAAVHLGDYIYEYARGGYASANAEALGRLSEPPTEIVTLADYRARHAQYKTDIDLQALHARVPMIAVWDDHEITNDTWKDGAENHQPATEGDFGTRRAAAIRAYHEWMPTRVASPEIIYRSFDFGQLLSLHMLDTRVIARDQQLDYSTYFTASGFNAALFTADISNPTRQLLGGTQTSWLQQRLAASSATWQVLGQQVLIGRMNIPAPILADALQPGSGVTVSQYAALVAKAQTAPATLTPQEQAILAQPSIPYNLDAWDGYAVARETVFGIAKALDKNLVVLSGDTHNAWANDLLDLGGTRIGVEFATASVTSPGFEAFFPNENPAVLAGSLTQLIGPLVYCDTARRGYMLLTAKASECRADWVYVNTISSRSYSAVSDKALKVLPGATGRRIVDL